MLAEAERQRTEALSKMEILEASMDDAVNQRAQQIRDVIEKDKTDPVNKLKAGHFGQTLKLTNTVQSLQRQPEQKNAAANWATALRLVSSESSRPNSRTTTSHVCPKVSQALTSFMSLSTTAERPAGLSTILRTARTRWTSTPPESTTTRLRPRPGTRSLSTWKFPQGAPTGDGTGGCHRRQSYRAEGARRQDCRPLFLH